MAPESRGSSFGCLVVIAYVALLYAAVLLGDRMLAMSYAEAEQLMGEHADRVRRLRLFYPAASLVPSMFLLAAFAQQNPGSTTRSRIFLNGLMACAGGNLLAFQSGKWVVGNAIASEWAAHLDSYRLNLLTTFVAPGAAWIGACLLVFLLKPHLKPE
jgi:hypothetical protein